ncbi:hypothetical protein QR680_019120 [Steinernema hermaphroditum]|uniref:MIF4G domain-containing protein n=1 Tax=Steinernema hermaphroditum TaxID=289476 RepID=A0AA39HM69_9BILA|nr:hypothetical protein QR680_019120 [Steinernema hermaphroditum]
MNALVYSKKETLVIKAVIEKTHIDSKLAQRLRDLKVDLDSAPVAREWKRQQKTSGSAPCRFGSENQELRAPRWGQKKQEPMDRRFQKDSKQEALKHDTFRQVPPRAVQNPRNERLSPKVPTHSSPLKDLSPIHWAEKAWKPRRGNTDPVEAKAKEIRGLLNKITPTTFDDLAKKFLEEDIYKNAEVLPSVVDIIFDKAVEEPTFCPLYSDLCARQVTKEKETANTNAFQSSIIRRCQKTFEAEGKLAFEEKITGLRNEISEKTEEKEKAVIEERIQELTKKERRRIIGNIGLIAQLYRNGLLNLRVINFAIMTLLKANGDARDGDEAAIECAIKLITDVGKSWVTQKELQSKKLPKCAKTQAEKELNLLEYVRYLDHHATTFCNRIRFAIKDLVELKNNKWEPRKSQAHKGPKTVEEVRAEARREKLQNQIEREQFEKEKKKPNRTPGTLRRR